MEAATGYDTHYRVPLGCAALFSGDLPTCATGLGWKVLSHQSVKEPEVCFYGSANVSRGNGLLGGLYEVPCQRGYKQCCERGFYWFALGYRR
jgi:hypothetical protein